MPRPTPNHDAVRAALRDERSAVEDANGSQAAGEEPAASAEAVAPEAGPEAAGDADAAAGTEAAEEQPQEDELAVALRERDEYLDLARRTQADFENYRKRSARDIAAAGGRARIGVIREILPSIDNLERALGAAPEGSDEAFLSGVRLVLADLQGALQRAGVEAIAAEGEPFDPNVHEALSTLAVEGATPGTVVNVIEKGYRTADTVVRPARVVVAS